MNSFGPDKHVLNIGIQCRDGHQARTPLGPLREIKLEHASEDENAVPSKRARRPRLVRRISSSLPWATKNHSKSTFTNGRTERVDENNGDDNANSQSHRVSVAECLSTSEAAKLMADEYLGRGADVDSTPIPSLSELDDSCDTNSQDKCVADSTSPDSARSATSIEDAIALEVGLNAHEYLEECFYTEVSVLNRAKFDAVPEVVKSDFSIKGHIGKGSFSDVFDVVCKDGRLYDATMNSKISGGITQLSRRRSSRGKKSTPLSSSLNMLTLARPSQSRDRRLAFAMKCLRPQIRADADQFTIGAEDLVHETAILANLDHRHVIKLHGRASGHLTDAFVMNDGYFIMLDKLNETLHDRMAAWKRTKCVQEGHTVKQLEVANSVADAMAYLHSKKIVFRDLKPDNVGFDCNGVMKLFDFGFAIGLPEEDEGNPEGLLYDRCGTPRYMAPEVGLSLGYGLSADVYSFGVLLWVLGSLAKPFPSITTRADFDRAVFVEGERPAIDDRWPANVKDLIGSCWSATPSERPSMLDIKCSLSLAIFNLPSGKKARTKGVLSRMASSPPEPSC